MSRSSADSSICMPQRWCSLQRRWVWAFSCPRWLTHFNVIIRGIVLRGADLPEVWLQLVKLAAFLAVMLVVAAVRFKKRLD